MGRVMNKATAFAQVIISGAALLLSTVCGQIPI